MSIDPGLVNVRDLTIRRPNRVGPGGDTNPVEDLVIATRLCAIYEQIHRISKGPRGEELLLEGIYHIDRCGPGGQAIDVRDRDYVEHTDLAGNAVRRRAIHFVSHWTLAPVDHIELEVSRTGATA